MGTTGNYIITVATQMLTAHTVDCTGSGGLRVNPQRGTCITNHLSFSHTSDQGFSVECYLSSLDSQE